MGNDEQAGTTTEPRYLDEIDEDRDEPKITERSWDGTKKQGNKETDLNPVEDMHM
jgi:hypothetical protein